MGRHLIVKNRAFLLSLEDVTCTIDGTLLMREGCGKSGRRILAMEKGKFSAMTLIQTQQILNGYDTMSLPPIGRPGRILHVHVEILHAY